MFGWTMIHLSCGALLAVRVHRKDLMQFLESLREEKVAEVFDHNGDLGLSGSCIINDRR
jgi:hypothetical protein